MNRIIIMFAIIALVGCKTVEPKPTVDYPADQLVDPITETTPNLRVVR